MQQRHWPTFQHHEVLAVAVGVPQEDVLVERPGGHGVTAGAELHREHLTGVPREQHDGSLQTGRPLDALHMQPHCQEKQTMASRSIGMQGIWPCGLSKGRGPDLMAEAYICCDLCGQVASLRSLCLNELPIRAIQATFCPVHTVSRGSTASTHTSAASLAFRQVGVPRCLYFWRKYASRLICKCAQHLRIATLNAACCWRYIIASNYNEHVKLPSVPSLQC